MKTAFKSFCMYLFVIMLIALKTNGQQVQYPTPVKTAQVTAKGNIAVNYTYQVFEAPNKMFGYDIFRNGKIIFHQGASFRQSDTSIAAIGKKEHAEQASLMAIEKIKKGEPAILTQYEIKKIVNN